MSGLGMGWRSGFAKSIRASTQEPSSTRVAKSRSWPHVRPVSIRIRGSGRPVSAGARATKSSTIPSMFSATLRRNAAFSLPERREVRAKAALANLQARSTSASVAEGKAGSSFSPVAGLVPWMGESLPAPRWFPIIEVPNNIIRKSWYFGLKS